MKANKEIKPPNAWSAFFALFFGLLQLSITGLIILMITSNPTAGFEAAMSPVIGEFTITTFAQLFAWFLGISLPGLVGFTCGISAIIATNRGKRGDRPGSIGLFLSVLCLVVNFFILLFGG